MERHLFVVIQTYEFLLRLCFSFDLNFVLMNKFINQKPQTIYFALIGLNICGETFLWTNSECNINVGILAAGAL